jgi:hypothetical protein
METGREVAISYTISKDVAEPDLAHGSDRAAGPTIIDRSQARASVDYPLLEGHSSSSG